MAISIGLHERSTCQRYCTEEDRNRLSGLYQQVSVRVGRPKITDSNLMKPNLVYMYYTHSGKWTSIFGKNRPYYIEIFTVLHRLYSICIEV